MGHWYTAQGTPTHEIVGANGKLRSTTLRDARKLGLYPSVTTIMDKVLAKQTLEDWKLKQVSAACRENRHLLDLPEDQYHGAIMEAAFKQVDEAADFGSGAHEAIERYYTGQPFDPDYTDYVAAVEKWQAENGIVFDRHEFVTVSTRYGYAGTVDCSGSDEFGCRGVYDFKTRRTKEGKKVVPYESNIAQLAAYWHSVYQDDDFMDATAANVVLSSTEHGRVEVLLYSSKMLHDAFHHLFLPAVKIWQHINQYKPTEVYRETAKVPS